MSNKRAQEDTAANEEEEWIGPMPTEASKPKKVKVLEFEELFLDNLPSSETYEKSYMHRDVITHIAVTKTDFVITASCDGHVKFWKKRETGIEFVKHYRSHLGAIESMSVNSDGTMLCTLSDDKSLKIYDVVNFDMINMIKLNYIPSNCECIHSSSDSTAAVACSEKNRGAIHIYDATGSNDPIHTLEKLHTSPVQVIKYNPTYQVILSSDSTGMIEYWQGPKFDYKFPDKVSFQYKTDTDLYEFVKCKTAPTCITFTSDGKKFATLSKDRKVRVFKFLSGKMIRVIDESLKTFTELQQMRQQLPDMEFGRRMAVERDLDKSEAFKLANLLFDDTGNFLMYATMLGIKVINLYTNKGVRLIGKPENVRLLQLGLFQGWVKDSKAAATIEMKASDNPGLQVTEVDPTLFCTALKKNRFYLFSKRQPLDIDSAEADRDVFNEKPSKEEMAAATQSTTIGRVSDQAVLHTSLGDIHVKLFATECPKTVENFCVHSKNGYYNGHLFHRVIKDFMIQTGDPQGNGTGGESIWGGEFEDEIHPNLRHDRPYTLSMANAGPNTNGSQFFITVLPCAWLDNKHTVFGRVTQGMDVAQKISEVKVHPKTDKPYNEISIINISIK